ncbi:MAG: CPBP family intramembrane glutamic endopeptidase [Chthoniobacterales bacterium]
MNPFLKIFLFLAAVLVVTGFISPPIYWAGMALADSGWIPAAEKFPFYRYWGRIAQITAAVFLVPTAFWLKIGGLRDLGIEPNHRKARDVGVGLVAAILPLVVLAAVYLYYGVYKVREDAGVSTLIRILGTATAVSIFEEFIFRGVLLGLAIRFIGKWPGILSVSAIFALVHFFKPRGVIAREDVDWFSGFAILESAFSSVGSAAIFGGGCVTLFLIGIILAVAGRRTRSLWLPIGLHAGWILGQQSLNLFAKFRIKPPDAHLPWIGPNVVSGMVPTGVVPLVALSITAGVVFWYLSKSRWDRPISRGE